MRSTAELEQTIRAERSAALVVNTCSRRGKRFYPHARQILQKNGIAVADAYPVGEPRRLRAAVQDAISRGHTLIVVGGGDGTVSTVVDDFAYRDVVLGLLPVGTGNSYARTLEIPLSLRGAVQVITGGKLVEVDLGKAGDDYFANVADIGMSAAIAYGTPGIMKRYLGMLAYVFVGMGVLLGHRAFHCRLTVDGLQQAFRTHEVIIANGRIYGITPLAPHTSIVNERLTIRTMDLMNRWQLARLWCRVLLGRQLTVARMHRLTVRDVWVDADPPQYINIDGETIARTPIHFTVAPKALKVLVPATFRGE